MFAKKQAIGNMGVASQAIVVYTNTSLTGAIDKFNVDDYSLDLDELFEREMIDGISTLIHHYTQDGTDEDDFMSQHLDIDEAGVPGWSTALTKMTMEIMGMSCEDLRRKYQSMSEEDFQKKWAKKFANVHAQLFAFYHEMD